MLNDVGNTQFCIKADYGTRLMAVTLCISISILRNLIINKCGVAIIATPQVRNCYRRFQLNTTIESMFASPVHFISTECRPASSRAEMYEAASGSLSSFKPTDSAFTPSIYTSKFF